MITIKLKLVKPIDITDYLKQYSNVSHVAYNRLKEGLSLSETEHYIKDNMNNIDLMNADFIKVATNQVKNLIDRDENVVFGGKYNWRQYNAGRITKEEYLKKKLLPIMARGTIHDIKGNRKFELDIENHQVIFKPSKNVKFYAQIPPTKQDSTLKKLQLLCELGEAYFTCMLSNDYVWIMYDESIFRNKKYLPVKQRILAIDLNPNFIGVVVRDNQKIIYKEIIGLGELNKSKNKNKKKNEDYEISKRLVETAKHYHCEYFVYEKLEIKQGDKGKGKKFNKTCNQWRRTKILENINKRCVLSRIKIQPVVPQYSSFIGQIDNPDDYDMIAAAIELSRRGLLYIKKYKYGENVSFSLKTNEKIPKHLMDRWKKKLNVEGVFTYKQLYTSIKDRLENGYRLLFQHSCFSLRMKSCRSLIFTQIL